MTGETPVYHARIDSDMKVTVLEARPHPFHPLLLQAEFSPTPTEAVAALRLKVDEERRRYMALVGEARARLEIIDDYITSMERPS